MPAIGPYKRTCRQLKDGSYANNGSWLYLLHPNFAQEPAHYVRAFMLLQKDLIHLFEYIEPGEQNLKTYSFRIHELFMRTCIEVEANLTAILRENIYSKTGDLTMKDYKRINKTHRLSAYQVALPIWKGQGKTRTPFKEWETGAGLSWYQAYNKSKHNRHAYFDKATFDHLLEAMGGLVALLAAQFHTENYSSDDKGLSIGDAYSYGIEDKMETAIGGYFRVFFPTDWPEAERYSFIWNHKNPASNVIGQIDYDQL